MLLEKIGVKKVQDSVTASVHLLGFDLLPLVNRPQIPDGAVVFNCFIRIKGQKSKTVPLFTASQANQGPGDIPLVEGFFDTLLSGKKWPQDRGVAAFPGFNTQVKRPSRPFPDRRVAIQSEVLGEKNRPEEEPFPVN